MQIMNFVDMSKEWVVYNDKNSFNISDVKTCL